MRQLLIAHKYVYSVIVLAQYIFFIQALNLFHPDFHSGQADPGVDFI